jgi:hypothetical protein
MTGLRHTLQFAAFVLLLLLTAVGNILAGDWGNAAVALVALVAIVM